MTLQNSNNTLFHKAVLAGCAFLLITSQAMAEVGHDDEEEHEEGHIVLTQEQIEHAGIGLAQVGSGTIRDVLPVYGVIAVNAERVQSVSARFEGSILNVTKSIGNPVRKGETLATIEANESLNTYSIKSAINGVITERAANVGEQTASRALFVIKDFSNVWAELSLFTKDLPKVSVDQEVRIHSVNSTVTANGKIVYIAPYGDRNSQTITARVLIDNPDGRWSPGQFIQAEITLSDTVAPLVVRNEALQIVEGRSVVFVQEEKGFEPRPVTLGRSDGEVTELLTGLSGNETYVTSNSFILKSEMGKEDAEHGH
ncbi:efflux RND transporter periplasmic adaptor subunit [Paraglaciecola arctica]|uniref:RND family efflux transporter MFP subunit n=1 Tax=Paraglaciecola arctica BSs20135 TaxID=493475 RepID=K6Y6A2_9ALTE|nr:efflux RND transporter periplasmic adaptor subunit [Paraglaciecola arctica]GAC19491.1 RND family efflux transporter MFP subunit [Paraglaciecola arctica BSs20135]